MRGFWGNPGETHSTKNFIMSILPNRVKVSEDKLTLENLCQLPVFFYITDAPFSSYASYLSKWHLPPLYTSGVSSPSPVLGNILQPSFNPHKSANYQFSFILLPKYVSDLFTFTNSTATNQSKPLTYFKSLT